MENFIVFSDKFSEGKVRASWIPPLLNHADILQDNPEDPIGQVKLELYCEKFTFKEDKMANLLRYIKTSNTFLTVHNGELKCTMKSTDDLKDFAYLDKSRKRAQMTKKGVVVGGCYRMCKP